MAQKTHKILYIQYNNPAAFPPLEHSSRLLADAGWQVLFLGIGAGSGAGELRFPPRDRIKTRLMTSCRPGLRQKLHYLQFILWATLWTLWWRPRWVYASDVLSAPAGVVLSLLPGVRVIYHEHDSPTGATPTSSFMRLCRAARKWLAHRSAFSVLPNQQRARRFAAEMGEDNVFCVWNCPLREEVAAPRLAHDDSLWIVYHGSIVPPRLPPTVIEALAILPDNVKLRVIGYETIGSPGYVTQLREMAGRLGIGDRVEFLGALNMRSELLDWGRKSDIGLAFMPRNSDDVNMQHMTGASNKPFDYLACGAALLVSDRPDWRQLYVDSGYGLACDPESPESIAGALRWFLDHPEEMRRMGEQGRQRVASEWCYETQFAAVVKQMNGKDNGQR